MNIDCSKLKPGDVCVTYGGADATYIGKHPHCERYIFVDKLYCWLVDSEGYAGLLGGCARIISLKPRTGTIKGWVNVYPGFNNDVPNSVTIYNSLDMAKRHGHDPIACVQVEIPYTEGEGLS